MLMPLDVAPDPVVSGNDIIGVVVAAVVVLAVLIGALVVLRRVRSQRGDQGHQQTGQHRGGVDDQRRQQ